METPREALSLTTVVKSGEDFVIAESVSVKHVPERQKIAELTLEPGDVIHIQSYDDRFGLVFTSQKHKGPVVISPDEAARIRVEA